ncbi:MAG: c-type cytochrome [Candidatus Binataceae bacterium]
MLRLAGIVAAIVCLISAAAIHVSADGAAPAAKLDYRLYCARCHGFEGRGDGPAARTLTIKPRNFTDCGAMAKIPNGVLKKVIQDGGPAAGLSSEMPAWREILSDAKIDALVKFIRGFCGK